MPITPQQLREAITGLEREIHPNCKILARLGGPYDSHPVVATVYPYGFTHAASFQVLTDQWETLCDSIRAAWTETRTKHEDKLVDEIAKTIFLMLCASDSVLVPELEKQFGAEAIAHHFEAARRKVQTKIPVPIVIREQT